MMPRRSGGVVLLIVVGVLGILCVLGAAFVTLARLERKASEQRLNASKARLLARSGVEDALARLSAGQDPSLPDNAYGGEDWDASGGPLSGFEAQQEVFQAGTPNGADCPLRQALRPSFFVRALPSSDPALQPEDTRQRGWSGALGASSLRYALKVEDESGKLNVNGGFLDAQDRDADGTPDFRDVDVRNNPADPRDSGRGWNAQLTRVLDVLGATSEINLAGLGPRILGSRPPGGYRSLEDLQARTGIAQDLSPYLTTCTRADASVLHPNAYASQGNQAGPSEVKKTRLPLVLEEGGRPPVNLNAASRPVLVALLQGLKGMGCWATCAWPTTYTINAATASAVAGGILQRRGAVGPFGTWKECWEFLDGLVPAAFSGIPPTAAGNLGAVDLLKANLDPNSQLNKQSPDQLMWRWVDKSDLTVWSTEGCLHPTGTFRISASGRLVDSQGRLLAQADVSGLFEVFHLLKQTSQKDFVAGRQNFQDYLSLSSGSTGALTTGCGSNCSWKTWSGAGGLAVTSTPCPPTALPGAAAAFDGALALASVDLEAQDPPNGSLLFLHHFDDSWDADTPAVPAARTQRQPGPADGALQTDLSISVWPDPNASAPANEPNTLLPDGLHAQSDRAPSYQALGNFPSSIHSGDPAPSDHGVISYWAKAPNYWMTVGEGYRIDFQCGGGVLRQQFLVLGRHGDGDGWGILMKNCSDADSSDLGRERVYRVNRSPHLTTLLPGQRWHLITAHFDTDEAPDKDLSFLVQGITATSAVADPVAGYPDAFTLGSGEEFSVPGVVFTLGGSASAQIGTFVARYQINTVLDELAIYDFGDTAAQALNRSTQWAVERYREGRYYKGDDGAFLSAALPLPGRLLKAWWTQYLPADPRQEVLAAFKTGGVPPQGQARDIEPPLRSPPGTAPRAWLELDLLGAGGGLADPVTRPLAQGGAIRLALPAFRYRVRWRTNPVDPVTGLPDALNQPLLETPWLDDVTFSFQSGAGPACLAWTP